MPVAAVIADIGAGRSRPSLSLSSAPAALRHGRRAHARHVGHGADAIAIEDLDALADQAGSHVIQRPVRIAVRPDAAMIGGALGRIARRAALHRRRSDPDIAPTCSDNPAAPPDSAAAGSDIAAAAPDTAHCCWPAWRACAGGLIADLVVQAGGGGMFGRRGMGGGHAVGIDTVATGRGIAALGKAAAARKAERARPLAAARKWSFMARSSFEDVAATETCGTAPGFRSALSIYRGTSSSLDRGGDIVAQRLGFADGFGDAASSPHRRSRPCRTSRSPSSSTGTWRKRPRVIISITPSTVSAFHAGMRRRASCDRPPLSSSARSPPRRWRAPDRVRK